LAAIEVQLTRQAEQHNRNFYHSLWQYHTQYQVTVTGGGQATITIRVPAGNWCRVDTIGIIATGTRTGQQLEVRDTTGVFGFHRFGTTTPFWKAVDRVQVTNDQVLTWSVNGVDTTTRIYVIIGLQCPSAAAMVISTALSSATLTVLADYNGAAGTFTTP